jgi:hypothetical protein
VVQFAKAIRQGRRQRRYRNTGVTPDVFRRMALSLPQAAEVFRYGCSAFRIRLRTFATLGGPGDSVAVVRLTAEQQATLVGKAPAVFKPVGSEGPLRTTSVRLASADEATVNDALTAAWSNVARTRASDGDGNRPS